MFDPVKTYGQTDGRTDRRTDFKANNATVPTVLPFCEWKKLVAAYYFLKTIMWRVDLKGLYAKVHETWHYV